MRRRDLTRRALALLPAADASTTDLVLFALGAGTIASVAVSVVEQLVRLIAQRAPPLLAGEALAVAVGTAIVVLARGLDRAALWVVGVRALSLAGTFAAIALAYAYVGPSTVRDPLRAAGPVFGALLVGAAAGVALGMVGTALLPRAPRAARPDAIVRTVGVAVASGAVVHFIWPTTFLLAAARVGPESPAAAVLQLPELLAGPIAGGLYAAWHRVGYAALATLGLALALPSAIVELVVVRALVEAAADPALRSRLAVASFLLALRIAAWPLAAAFAQGFLTPTERAPTVAKDHS